MKVLMRVFVGALVFAGFCSCEKTDEELQREILTEMVWTPQEREDNQPQILYKFGTNGIMSVFVVLPDESVATRVDNLRYIFNPRDSRISIETMGEYRISSIEVNRLHFVSDQDEISWIRYRGSIEIH